VLGDGTHTSVYGHQRLLAVQGDTHIWHIADALGSLRMTLDSTGTPQSLHSYNAWGVVQEGTPAPFGFTGEVQQAGLVYLRARWYAAGSGTFTSRDPFAGYAQQPYSLHPYQYAYSDPLLWTDPSGEVICPEFLPWCKPLRYNSDPCLNPESKECPSFSDGWVRAHREEIIRAGTNHAQPGKGFDRKVMATILSAVLLMENSYTEAVNGGKDRYGPVNIDIPLISDRAEGDVQRFIPGMTGNPSTGPANVTIHTAWDMVAGTMVLEDGSELCIEATLLLESTVRTINTLDEQFQLHFPRYKRSPQNQFMYRALQDTTINLDMAGAVLEMGIYRASEVGTRPTIYNLATWYNGGVQTIQAIDGNFGAKTYGAGIIGLLERSASLLGYGNVDFISNTLLIMQEEADLVFALEKFGEVKSFLEGRNFQKRSVQ
jgi:RHS repeat-associated protein